MHVPVSCTYDAYNYLSTATPQPLLISPTSTTNIKSITSIAIVLQLITKI
jgi:hypothetical protein